MLGATLGRYRVIEIVGKGGMGVVYRAHDDHLARDVALKVLSEGALADEAERRRFQKEAHALSRLNHPNVASVFDFDTFEGVDVLVMELVPGTSLDEKLRDGALSQAEVVDLGLQLAQGLEAAHREGIVHRDLKPGNLRVNRDGRLKILDFGLARMLPAVDDDGPTATLTHTAAGTPPYMAPEQLRGDATDVRTDIHGCGAVLYEMATGKRPFTASSAALLTDTILHDPPVAPSTLNRGISPGLERIILKALQKDPRDRHQSCQELAFDLHALNDPQSRRTRTHLNRLAPALIALVATVGVGLAWWLWPVRLSLSQRALAFNERDWILIADFDNETKDPVFDRSLRVALDVAIAQSQYVNVFPSGRLPEALRFMKKAPTDKLDEALAVDVAVREHVKAVLACSIADVGGVYALTAKVIDPQSRVAVGTESVQARGKGNVLAALDELATRVRRNLGESLAGVSAQNVALPRATTASLEALRLYADSLRDQEGDLRRDLLSQAIQLDPDFALAHAALGHANYLSPNRAERQKGETHFLRAVSLLDRLSRRERLWISALAEDSRGNRDAAALAYRTYLSEYPDDQAAWFRIGWTYLAGLRQYDLAVEAFKRSIELRPSHAGSYINLATAYSALNKDSEAVALYQRAFDLNPSVRTDTIVNHEYGFVLVKLGDLDGAAENFALMLAEKSTSNQARGHRSMALLEMYRGRYAAAIAHLRQAVVINKTNDAKVSEYRDRLYLSRAYLGKGRTQAFAAELDAAHRLALDSTLAPEWLRRIAKAEARAGRVGQARTILAMMSKTAGDATAAASVNRNAAAERAHFDVVRGEIELAERRPLKAVALFEAAFVIETQVDTLESLATALLAVGRLEDAAKRYGEILAQRQLGNETQDLWLAAHVNLAQTAQRLGRAERARELYTALITQWADADDDLVLLKDARQALARLK
jgi:serine/threonine protein kinase/tetratricopeptide (TPR) repeat protein